MVTPQELRAAMATADEEVLRELEAAIDTALKKDWVGGESRVVFVLGVNAAKTYSRRVLDQTIDKYRRKGWAVAEYPDAHLEDTLTFSEAPVTPGIVCCCAYRGQHVRGCGAVLRNPQ